MISDAEFSNSLTVFSNSCAEYNESESTLWFKVSYNGNNVGTVKFSI